MKGVKRDVSGVLTIDELLDAAKKSINEDLISYFSNLKREHLGTIRAVVPNDPDPYEKEKCDPFAVKMSEQHLDLEDVLLGEGVKKALFLIEESEPEFYNALKCLILHLANTYKDKYEATKNLLDTKQQLYHPEKGRVINQYQIARYLQRYLADGKKFEKGENMKDLLKICHYALFDVVRLGRMQETKNIDSKN